MLDVLEIVEHGIVFFVGLTIVIFTVYSAIRTFVLPRSSRDPLTAFVFVSLRRFMNIFLRRMPTYEQRDHLMAFYAPIALILLQPTWYSLLIIGYTLMFWAVGIESWYQAFLTSGSSLLTLGFATVEGVHMLVLVFSEATLGLLMVALLIAYIPTIYSAFSRREFEVTRLEVRAGSPASPVEFLLRHHRLNRLQSLTEFWQTWEQWFADLEESHTSLAALVFFRSPQHDKSWMTAASCVLDTAALVRSTIDVPTDPQADICIRAGYLALQRIADFFGIVYPAKPHFPEVTISITREEYDAVYDQLMEYGLKLKEREQAWLDFAGWRVNYDTLVVKLAYLTMSPAAMWSSDRMDVMRIYNPSFVFFRRRPRRQQ